MGSVSKGCLTVRDVTRSGPAAVEIDSGFLTERADVDALVEAMDTIMDLAATAAYAELIDKPLMPPDRLSRADKEAFVRRELRDVQPPLRHRRHGHRAGRGRRPGACGSSASTACTSPTPR